LAVFQHVHRLLQVFREQFHRIQLVALEKDVPAQGELAAPARGPASSRSGPCHMLERS